jgi:L-fuconolactonase
MAMLRRDFLPEDLKPELDLGGFSGAVAVQARQTSGRDTLAPRTRRQLAIHSGSGRVGRSAFAASARAIKSICSRIRSWSGFVTSCRASPTNGFCCSRIFSVASPCLRNSISPTTFSSIPGILRSRLSLCGDFPGQRFVLDHLGKPPIRSGNIDSWAHGIARLAEFPNVFCKLSGLVTEANWQHWQPEQIVPFLDVAFASFGPDRLMIGSDWPVCLVAASYTRVIEVVKTYLLGQPQECRDSVLGGNARRFWRLAER